MDPDALLVIFQRIDHQLTLLDAQNQKLHDQASQIERARKPAARKRQLKKVQHSAQYRERLKAVNSLLATTSRAEDIYRKRHQRYGARLFHDFEARLVPLKTAILLSQHSATVPGWRRREEIASARFLSTVAQFQAISGGYAALACRPGTWACCQPRQVGEGPMQVRGCSWSCAAETAACRGGCLGPRIPNTVVAIRNKPKRPVFAASSTVASTKKEDVKAANGSRAAARAQVAAGANQ
jgi:hypothetical protein